MARPDGHPPSPRVPTDLPSHPDLRLTEDSDLYRLIIEGDFSEANLEQMTIEESQVLRSAFVGADLGRPTAAVLELQRLAPIGSASHSAKPLTPADDGRRNVVDYM